MHRSKLSFLLLCSLVFAANTAPHPRKPKKESEMLYQVTRPTIVDGTSRTQFGFIDRTGKMVIGFDQLPKTTWYVGEFHDGLAVIHMIIGKSYEDVVVGYIDMTGKIAIPTKFSYARDFSEGLAYVETKEFRGYINDRGNLIIRIDPLAGAFVETATEKISGKEFHEGLAAVGTGRWSKMPYARDDATYGNTVWGYIDRSGKLVIKPAYRFAENFSEGRAGVVVDHKYGFIDTTGKMIVAPRFEPKRGGPHSFGLAGTSQFHEGRALVQEDLYGSAGYIDRDGNYAIPPRFIWANDFSEGVAWAAERDEKTGAAKEMGWIDKSGNWVLPLKKEGLHESSGKKFSEGLAAVWLPINNKREYLCAYIDHNGKEVIKRAFADCHEFIGGIASVRISGSYAYIDKTGRIIWQPR
jgi:hypothetical protein